MRQRVESGEINASAGYELSRVNDPVKQAELAQQLGKGSLPVTLWPVHQAGRKPLTRGRKRSRRG